MIGLRVSDSGQEAGTGFRVQEQGKDMTENRRQKRRCARD